jgi:uncharacterized protein (DUF433 family)
MTAVLAPIVINDAGVAYVEGTAIKVIEIARAWRSVGESLTELAEAFPHLTLEQLHAALSYYHGHQAELDADMKRRDRLVDRLVSEAEEHPFTRRMRAAGRLPG